MVPALTITVWFQDMPEAERHKEEERLKDVEAKYNTYIAKIKEARKKFGIMGIK